MSMIIGMDPHKRSATVEVVDDRGRVLAVGRYGTDKAGYTQMLAAGREYPDRVWAIEGCNPIGRHIAHRLVHDGETVVDVPAKLSAQVRVFATGNGRTASAHCATALFSTEPRRRERLACTNAFHPESKSIRMSSTASSVSKVTALTSALAAGMSRPSRGNPVRPEATA